MLLFFLQAKHLLLGLAAHCAAAFPFALPGQAQLPGNFALPMELAQNTLPPPALSPLQKNLAWLLENGPAARFGFTGLHDQPEQADQLLLNLYMDNGMRPFWVAEYGVQAKAGQLLAALDKAEEDGLDPARYRAAAIAALLSARDMESLARLDVMLTLAMNAYITDMRKGQAASTRLDTRLFAAVRDSDSETDVAEVVREGLNRSDLTGFFAQQAPQHRAYRALKELLAQYRRLEAAGGWPQIPPGPKLEPGMADHRLELLARRLLITGDLAALPAPLAAAAGQPSVYEGELVKAVKRFQLRYNLKQDGIVGKATLNALNIPVHDHISKIRLNLERWRWLPHQLGDRRILVNIAGFTLTSMNNEATELFMPVIVGEIYNKTPVFSHVMTYIEINPYWTVPPSIARKEIVPKMRKDPGYLSRQRIRIFADWHEGAPEIRPSAINWHTIGSGITRYRLRQDSGPGNALGRIKFMFPNSNNIYMHDTPGQALFQQTQRTFSHGCIRLSRPLELAWHILRHDGHNVTKEGLQKAVASKRQQVFVLKKPLPVHILYLTALGAEDGSPHFYDDIYGYDSQLAEALLIDSPDHRSLYSYQ
ncbi:MAG: L,D-transpeptidase family protein [Candidatus Electronema sp. VV]